MLLPRPNKFRVPAAAGLFLMLLTALTGCASGKYGTLKPDKQVLNAFQGYQMLQDHKYYYRGVASRPEVIAGINQGYQMKLKMWTAINLESGDFKTLVERVSLQGLGSNVEPWGMVILDHQGNRIGVWYSAARAATVEVNENRQIINLAPIRFAAIGEQH